MNFLTDENLSQRFVNALRRHNTNFTVVRVQEIGLIGMDDTAVLDWAANNDHILITKDRATISPLVTKRLAQGLPSPKILIIRPTAELKSLLLMIEAIVNYSQDTDWQYPVRWIP